MSPVTDLDVGLMTAEITLQTAQKVQSHSGEEVFDWDNADTITEETIWAMWLPAGSRESWMAQQRLASYVDGVFRIYDSDEVADRPTPDDTRILFNGRTFDLKPYVEVYKDGRVIALDLPVVARGE